MRDLFRDVLSRIGRPRDHEDFKADGHDLDAMDGRIGDLEERQRQIAARLRLLELSADPRGRRSPS